MLLSYPITPKKNLFEQNLKELRAILKILETELKDKMLRNKS